MYSPKIEEELIPQLYKMAKAEKMPMTKIVNRLVREKITEYKAQKKEVEIKSGVTKVA